MIDKTIAQQVAEILGEDGERFETKDGRDLEDVCSEHGAQVTYADRVQDDDGTDTDEVKQISRSEVTTRSAIRYGFNDGSAIVVWGGGAWDLEGSTPFSWAGLE